MSFLLDWQSGQLNNGNTTFAPSFRCLFWLDVSGNDYDNGTSVQIEYPASGTFIGSTAVISGSSGNHRTELHSLKSGDVVRLNTSGTTNINYFYLRIPDSL